MDLILVDFSDPFLARTYTKHCRFHLHFSTISRCCYLFFPSATAIPNSKIRLQKCINWSKMGLWAPGAHTKHVQNFGAHAAMVIGTAAIRGFGIINSYILVFHTETGSLALRAHFPEVSLEVGSPMIGGKCFSPPTKEGMAYHSWHVYKMGRTKTRQVIR